MTPRLQQEIDALAKERESRTPAQKKIHSQLLFASRLSAGVPAVAGVPRLHSTVRPEADGRVRVRVTAKVTPAVLAAIPALGGAVLSSFPQYDCVYALMPLANLEALSARSDVVFVGIPPKIMTNSLPAASGSAAQAFTPAAAVAETGAASPPEVDTAVNDPQGDAVHGAYATRQYYGVNGSGVKVGVLSDSDDNGKGAYAAALKAGYITAVTVPAGQSGGAQTAEGLAMLEVVHRIAPGAKLYFATGDSSVEQTATNIEMLQADGCKIILDDEASIEVPFQDGIIALAIDAVTAKGVLYFSCSGNFGNYQNRNSSCWEGNFAGTTNFPHVLDFAANSGDPNGVKNFNSVNSLESAVDVALFWAEPKGNVTSQYNLYEVNPEGEIVQEADDPVATTEFPAQVLANVVPGNTIAVELASGYARFLHLEIAAENSFFGNAGTGRTCGHNACDAVNSFTVAAAPAAASFGETDIGTEGPSGPYPNEFTAANQIEPFSSDGPRVMFFHPNGTAITPGVFTYPGGKTYQKPDFTAADGVSTSLPAGGGLNPFYGTSCATPHAGALAALAWSFNPYLTAGQIASALHSGALEITHPGPAGSGAGAGILMAPKIFTAVINESKPKITSFSPTSGPVGTTVVIKGSNYFKSGLDVYFDGTAVTSGNFTATQATAVVPAGAKTGKIEVENYYGTVTSTGTFTVTK